MNPSTKRAVLSASLTALILVSPVIAYSWERGGNRPPILKDAAIKESLGRFDALIVKISADYAGKPELPGYVKIVTEAKANFQARADVFLPEMPYQAKEFRVMSDLVRNTVIKIEDQVKVQDLVTRGKIDQLTAQTMTVQIEHAYAAANVATFKSAGMAPMLPQPAPPKVETNQITGGAGGLGLTGQAGMAEGTLHGVQDIKPKPRGRWNGGYYDGDEEGRKAWEEEVGKNSFVAILALQSTNCAMDHKTCIKDPAPTPTPQEPAPVKPGEPVVPAPWTGPTNESASNEVAGSIATGGGPSVLATQSVLALQSGDYARAGELARNTLRFDPGNRSALEVLYSVKGRGDAMDAGDAGRLAARNDAAALGTGPGPDGFAPGGGGSASAEIAALAAAGAARVSSEQSTRGAMGALRLGDAPSALAILNKALAADPNNPGLLNLRATTYAKLGRWDEAAADAARGLEILPNNPALLVTKSFAENRSRRYKDALASANAALAADPRNAWAFANRAYAEAGLGDREAMLADLNRAAALDPRFAKVAENAATLVLPSDGDVIFLFPGEAGKPANTARAPAAGRGRGFGVVVGAGILGGLLLAFGLLSTVLAPIKDTVVSAFTRVKRAEPASGAAVVTAQPASVSGNVGGLIRGQYEISRQIGAGGMGMVYEGTDRSLGRRVAIKKMREELRLNARERDRFIIEAKTVASLHHPSIVDIYAIAEEGEDVYLVFEYVDGKTVHDLVQTAGRLEIPEAVRITRAMGEALAYAHSKGVIHRDMKPSNVMLTAAGAVKVMDFGIARMAKDAMTRYSMTNTVVGTPPYMAPEQEQGVVRKESDVYALAICAYEMLTGKLPFIGMGAGMLMNKINMSYIPPSRNIAGLPESLDAAFEKAFQADPERRYRTPLEFVAALEGAAGGARAPRTA